MDRPAISATVGLQEEAQPRTPLVDKLLDLPEAEREKAAAAKPPSFPIPNPTMFPDRLFASFIPILIIRHPCRSIPSLKRALQPLGAPFSDGDAVIDSTYAWQRMMYECYRAWFATPEGIEAAGSASAAEELPIVIDGDKLVGDPEGQMNKLCRILELDPAGVQYTWEARPAEDMGQALFIGTLSKSTGDGNDRVPVLEDQVKKWTEEWDEQTAQGMKGLVEKTIKDYELLLERSI
ncbi:hypothetical protein L218DRAFT_863773 [Marasmius fiardii PR-910]|nr:hypothetical protein L218DRAFT_863773 [Marasmius fiardii PR-910]